MERNWNPWVTAQQKFSADIQLFVWAILEVDPPTSIESLKWYSMERCMFWLLSFGVIGYTAIDNENTILYNVSPWPVNIYLITILSPTQLLSQSEITTFAQLLYLLPPLEYNFMKVAILAFLFTTKFVRVDS